jgi:hypothetical protein
MEKAESSTFSSRSYQIKSLYTNEAEGFKCFRFRAAIATLHDMCDIDEASGGVFFG